MNWPAAPDPSHVRMYSVDRGNGTVRGEPQLALPINVEDHGEVRLYRFTLPFLPPSKNQYDTLPWQYQQSMKGKWVRHVIRECEQLMVPKGMTRVGLSAALVFPTARRRDPQNYSATIWNFVPDALQKGGFLLDDRDGCIDFGSNLGIKFHVDCRTAVPDARRKKTHIALAVRMDQ